MMMKSPFPFIFFLLSVLIFSSCTSSNLSEDDKYYEPALSTYWSQYPERPIDTLVDIIASINRVDHKYTGIVGKISDQYFLFDELRTRASIEELVTLTGHSNGVVACYAGWGLIDREYPYLDRIFADLVTYDCKIETMSGCTVSEASVSSEFYFYYLSKLGYEAKAWREDRQLALMDSIVIYGGENNFILAIALSHREYPASYYPHFETSTFQQKLLEIIKHLHVYHPKNKEERARMAVIKSLIAEGEWHPSKYPAVFKMFFSIQGEYSNMFFLAYEYPFSPEDSLIFLNEYDQLVEKYGL